MAIDLETIRRITILARTEGVEKATAELQKLGGAQDAIAGTAEKTTRANLSAERSFESLQRRVDVTHRAQKDYERDVGTLVQAHQQGLIPSTARLNELLALTGQRYNQTVAGGRAFAAATEAATVQAGALASSLGGVGTVLTALGPLGLAAAAAIGALGLALIGASKAADQFAEDMGRIRDASRTLGITTLQFQALADAGAELGLSEDRIRTGFERMTGVMEEFSRRTGAAYEQVRRVDPVLADQLAATQDLTLQIDLLGRAYERMSAQQRAALARALFGRGGQDLGLLLQQIQGVQGGVAALEQSFQRSGDAIDAALIQRVTVLQRAIADTAADAQRNFASIFSEPVLTAQLRFVEGLREISRVAKEFTVSPSLSALLDPRTYSQLLFKTVPEFALQQFTGKPAEPSTFGPDEAGMAGMREYLSMQQQVTANQQRQLALEQQQLAVAGARSVTDKLIAQENVAILQALMAGKSVADAIKDARLATAIAEAQIRAAFDTQVRLLEQQVELAHERTEEGRAALSAEHAYENAIRGGALQSQAMAISSATLELALARAAQNAAQMVPDFAAIAATSGTIASNMERAGSAWVKGLNFEGTSGGDSGISALINVPAGGGFRRIAELTRAETEARLAALQKQPQVPWVKQTIDALNEHLRELTDSVDSLNATIGLSELYMTDPRQSHIGFRGFRHGGIMTSEGALPLHSYRRGGIARRPQLALFGEASVPEAYVPVPSGRIPVKLDMPRGQGERPIQIVQNFTGMTAAETRNQMKQSAYQLAQDLRRTLT